LKDRTLSQYLYINHFLSILSQVLVVSALQSCSKKRQEHAQPVAVIDASHSTTHPQVVPLPQPSSEAVEPLNLTQEKYQRLLDRDQLSSRLLRVFGETPATIAIIEKEIQSFPEVFGGQRIRNESTESNVMNVDLSALNTTLVSSITAIRAGRLQRACASLVSNSVALDQFRKLITNSTVVSPPTAELAFSSIRKLNLGYELSQGTPHPFDKLLLAAKQRNYSVQTQWQILAFALCSSLAMEGL
jgi:hypothetical protein